MNLEILTTIFAVKSLKARKILAFFLIFITVHGLVGFMMFIAEESMQTAMFGAFAYKTAGDYKGLDNYIKHYLKPINTSSKILIYGFGWMAPLMYPAYISYLKANDGFIKSQENLVKKKFKN